MGYAEFEATLKKINLKPKGVKEVVLEITDGALAGKIDMLSELIDSKIAVSVDSQVVRYNVQINARTQEPIKRYQVDNAGIVSEIKKEEGEQIEMNLGLPKDKTPIADVPVEISREVVDEFILEGFAPNFDDLPYSYVDWLLRMEAGDTYSRIATDEGLSSGVVVEQLDEYRKRVAPLAAKWDEWREGAEPADAVDPDAGEDPNDEPGTSDTEQGGQEPPVSTQRSISEDDDAALLEEMEGGSGGRLIDQDTPDWMQEAGEGGSREQEVQFEGDGAEAPESDAEQAQSSVGDEPSDQVKGEPAAVDKDALDAFILTERPVFPEVEFNGMPVPFADLWEQRLQGSKTWIEIAKETGMTSGQLSARRAEYKKLATKKMQGGGGAA